MNNMKITAESVKETISESWITVETNREFSLKLVYELSGNYEVYRKSLLVISTSNIDEAVDAYNGFIS